MAEQQKIPIGIIGLGMVGGALGRWFRSQGHPVIRLDPPKNIGKPSDLERAEVIFVCVPTPFDEATGRFDGSIVISAVALIPGEKTVIVKSTVLPGTMEDLQARYPHHRMLFSPEFLTESTADEDMARPRRTIIGYTAASKPVAEEVLALFPRAPFERIMPSREAEFFKYLRNTFFAAKVVFFNQMYDLARSLGVDYETIRECAANDPWIAGQHMTVWHNGYRGYGGKCLPKDTKAFIAFAVERGVPQHLLEVVEEINAKLVNERPPAPVPEAPSRSEIAAEAINRELGHIAPMPEVAEGARQPHRP